MSKNNLSPKIGRVIWITGLSGAGKTTFASTLLPYLPETTILLDGDELRAVLGVASSGFDYQSRKQLAFTYARFAQLLAKQGFTVVVATISLFHDLHAWNRENLPNYLEIFLDVPEAIRKARDPKGLYQAVAQGKETQMAGSAITVEFPLQPDLKLSPPDKVTEQDIPKILQEWCKQVLKLLE